VRPGPGAGPYRERNGALVKLAPGFREVCWRTGCGRQPVVAVTWLGPLRVWVCGRHEPPADVGDDAGWDEG